MKTLTATVSGKKYIAPRPRALQFKEYIRFLNRNRITDDPDAEFDAVLTYIASLFQDPSVTADSIMEGSSFDELALLYRDYLEWVSQFIPEKDSKNV